MKRGFFNRLLKDADDLDRIDDSELIRGANEIGLVSDLGLTHLDYIRYMRNWASAAHPNQNQLTGLQLVSWLETCIVEVINLPESTVVVEIKKFLGNIKTNAISSEEAKQIAVFFAELDRDRINNLASGFFGIHTDEDTTEQTRQNIRLLMPELWPRVSETTRKTFGVKFAQFVANNDADRQSSARELLAIVGGGEYIPDGIRLAEIDSAAEALLTAHHGMNNFYTEPACARQLRSIIGPNGKIPKAVEERYVLVLVEVFLTNGNGRARHAEPTYTELLQQLAPNMALHAVLSFTDTHIASRLQFSLCQDMWKSLIEIMRPKISAAAAKELLEAMDGFVGPLDRMRDDSTIRSRVKNLEPLLKL